jgi:transposase
VCLETGEVEARELEGNSTAETSVAFLRQLRAHRPEPLIVLWDNGPAHSGDPLRAYSPDFNVDEAIWGWVRADVTANTCFGTKAKVRDKVGEFFRGLTDRTDEVKRQYRTVLQSQADASAAAVEAILQPPSHVDRPWLWFRTVRPAAGPPR